nr:thiol reductant ABC exporter subunit CydD [Comamonas composti]
MNAAPGAFLAQPSLEKEAATFQEYAAIALLVLASWLWLPQAWLLASGVQTIAQGRGLASLWPLAAGVALFGGLRAWCEAKGGQLASLQARDRLSAMRAAAVQALAASSPLDRERAASGQAASAMAEQAEAMVPWLSRYRSAQWRVRLVPWLLLAAVAWQSWVAALILLLAAPLIPLFMAIVGWRARAASEEQMVELGGMNAFLLDRLRGLSTLRALDAVDATARRLRSNAESLRVRSMRVLRIAFLSSAVLELFSALGVAMVAVYVGFHLLGPMDFGSWGHKLDLGQALFVLLLAPAFFEPLRELSAVWHDKAAGQAAEAALAQLGSGAQTLQGAGREEAGNGSSSPETATRGCALRLERLRIHAPGSSRIQTLPALELKPGEHLALCGPSGSGKSVLLAQIAGLLPTAESGRIFVDGKLLTGASAGSLRARMAWMGQRPHVFGGSMGMNLSLGRDRVSATQMVQAAERAGLGHIMLGRPGASLGEGGSGLSGGEVVRLALARLALSSEAGLLLVDEPTAHLDGATAAQVIQALLELARGRTLIVATHDEELAALMHRRLDLSEPMDIHPSACGLEERPA